MAGYRCIRLAQTLLCIASRGATQTAPETEGVQRMAEATGLRVEELGLFTDLYQLTMAQSYFAQ
jgi:hypothetical protein